jgi:hypothetical protein
VFNAGFVEASSDQPTFEITGDSLDNVDTPSEYTTFGAHPEDSDEEDEAYDPGEADGDAPNSDPEPEDVELLRDFPEPVSVESVEPADSDHNGEGEDRKSRNVRQKLAHPSSPRARNAQISPHRPATVVEREVFGPPKLRVVVKDVAYMTYRAVLYYVLPSSCFLKRVLTFIIFSCIRTVSVSRHCPQLSSRLLLLGRAAKKQQTIVKVALVPSPVQDRQKYLRVPARGENGSKIGYAKTPGIPFHAPQRLCTDSQTVSKTFVFRPGGQR